MLCRNPYVKAGAAYPCGQCMPCRFNRRRLWTNRIMLESLCHGDSTFATLTYDDDHLPVDGCLDAKEFQNWLKRFRKEIEPLKIRFYGVGEYGDISNRPHYHVIIFGYPTCVRGRTLRRIPSNRPLWRDCCAQCRAVGESWGLGDIDLGTVNKDSASYVAAYTVKKMTSVDDKRLNGRKPEFCRMSLRPGIGADFMWEVASNRLQFGLEDREVPTALMQGKSQLPLGRYLRNKLRAQLGKEVGSSEEELEALKEEMRPLREAAFATSSSLKEAVIRAGDGRVAQIDARNAIYRKDKKL